LGDRGRNAGVSDCVRRARPIDAPTNFFIQRLLEEATRAVGSTAKMPMLALFDIPGAVYILDGISLGYPWHSGASFEKIVCDRIRSDRLSRTPPRLVLLDRDEISASLTECLRQGTVDLARYKEVARIRIFADNTSGGWRPLRVLVPKPSSP
jgi:hypothetical protein